MGRKRLSQNDNNPDDKSQQNTRWLIWRATILLALLSVVFGLTLYFVLDPEVISNIGNALDNALSNAGPWGWLIIIGLMIAHCFVPIPAELVAIAAGASYGLIVGTILIWIGAMLGAILSFGLARWLGEPFIRRFLNTHHRAMLDEWKTKQGVPTLLVSRLIPLISFNLINYAAGLASVPWWTFLWTTAVGILPITILSVFVGSTMSELPMQWIIGLSILGVVLVIAIQIWFRHKRNSAS